MQGRRTILMVEDEESITVPLAEALAREGFDTEVAGTVAEALELAGSLDPDVVLLDVMLPDGSGFDVCRELRRESRVPIIMVTARGDEADRVVGLELELSRKEFDVLALLASEAGRVVTRERLLEEVWETSWFGSTKTLDVHVASLRRKLGDSAESPRYLHTVRGVGFRLSAPDELQDRP